VEAAKQAGATVLTGGERMLGKGNFYEPTVLTNLPRTSAVYRDELFGPVAMLFPAKSIDEAIEIANDTPFGLGASVWTQDSEEQKRCIAEIVCGQVFVNTIVASDPRLPFGGVKRSGYGRELSAAGMREFLNAKTVVIAGQNEQTLIPFDEPAVEVPHDPVAAEQEADLDAILAEDTVQLSANADPKLQRTPFDSAQFREAFRTALTDADRQAENVSDPIIKPRSISRISGIRPLK
jgi:succinate-semialdehyde dehydrogenase/glutarate-semialdehyde dehydrogenase